MQFIMRTEYDYCTKKEWLIHTVTGSGERIIGKKGALRGKQ